MAKVVMVSFVMKVKLPERGSLTWDQIGENWLLSDPEDYEAALTVHDETADEWFEECMATWLAQQSFSGGKYTQMAELTSIEATVVDELGQD